VLRRAETLDAKSFDIHFGLALVLLSENQATPTADELEMAIKVKPSAALAHVLLGRAYQNSNRTLQAIQQFQTALRLDPETQLGHYHLGFAYASLGRNPEAVAEYKPEAIAEYKNEIARSPQNPDRSPPTRPFTPGKWCTTPNSEPRSSAISCSTSARLSRIGRLNISSTKPSRASATR